MAREFTVKEQIKLFQLVKMLEEALELIGNDMINDLHHQMAALSEDAAMNELENRLSNIYTFITVCSDKLEKEYEEFKADPEVQAEVERRMELMQDALKEIEFVQGADNDSDEGDGNLQ